MSLNTEPTPVLTTNPTENTITFICGEIDMLRVAEDGFYVRGVKLTQDDKEINEVYNAFSEWLNWQILNRN
jgi:hypothetical protein